ncbi:P-loop containing nucleoside triphosphate hydrolase [Pseudocohnilembus persalinus]|uniref:p-loop containing nucleoside triphosphate hydrolase n=1 Tax=Pseudocohnilembus persalinus TaxID=266149 RepID=A0A0V0QWB9_PSEPJ|nr:P-loop containing nucleoside triphosphate hydrolase [Pseudocohnilembus persalinus]|eukprot:KRX06181.1 P-loop containing nucleoside triphosphate hydrolase [Pseudocohnilembus persalinus]
MKRAGKTTLFKILAGEHQATYGNVHINGINMTTDMEKARYHIGYCPQFDALLDKLTAKEHLELYAAIKGIPKQKREYLIEDKLVQLNLKKFENIPAGTYSGGNKRKLSVAIALLGNPPIILLDEPSTGMDPKARRFMWTVISEICQRNQNQKQQNNEKNSDAISKATIQNGNQVKKGSYKIQVREKENASCVILSTHSMEEAEALSNKMTIMVQGVFKCLGSIQHIKSKFGQGYEIEVKVKIPKQFDLEKLIKEESGQNKKQNENFQLNFQVNMKNLDQVLEQLGEKVQKVVLKEKNKKDEKNGRNFIFSVLENGQSVSLQILLEFYLIQEKNQIIQQFISSKFSKYQIIENYGSFTRYKIDTKESTGKIFAFFENAKQNLGIIDSYSVRQTTIEAIFNQFANNAINSENLTKNQTDLNQIGIQIKEQKYFQGENQVDGRNIQKIQNHNQQNENQDFQTQLIKVKTNDKN